MRSLDQTVELQQFIRRDDGIAANAELVRERPARRQTASRSQFSAEHGRSKIRADLLGLVARTGVQSQREVEDFSSASQSGRQY